MGRPSFPEIVNRQPKCACCRLAEDNPGVLRGLHRRHVAGESGEQLHDWLTEQLGEHTPTRGSIRRHLSQHVDMTLEGFAPEPLRMVPAMPGETRKEGGAQPLVAVAEAPKVDDSLGPTDEFWELYDSVRDILRRIDANSLFRDDDGKLDTFQVTAYTAVTREARQLMASIQKAHESKIVLDKILQSHTQRLILSMRDTLESDLLGVLEQIRGLSPQAAEVFEAYFRSNMGKILGVAGEEALVSTRDKYRITEEVED